MANALQGPAGAFTAVMAFLYGTQQDVLTLNNCIAQDASFSTKQGDFDKPTFGFMASTDSSDNLGTFASKTPRRADPMTAVDKQPGARAAQCRRVAPGAGRSPRADAPPDLRKRRQRRADGEDHGGVSSF
jgi:hypothetical protein